MRAHGTRPFLPFLAGFSFFLTSPAPGQTFVTPTVEVSPQTIQFRDDLDYAHLETAIQRQIDAYDSTLPLTGKVKFGDRIYPMGVLRDSLVLFRELARASRECAEKAPRRTCKREFNRAIRSRFRVYRPRGGDTRFTAYYSPDFEGSLAATERFRTPLYNLPEDPVLRESTREEILYGNALRGLGLESAWLDADEFELYSLQIEGGGRIRLWNEDGTFTRKYISYAGKNARPLRFFSALMKQHGWLAPNDLSYDSQARVFRSRPEIPRILASECPSYVYFKLTDEEPVGIHGIPLTENRSLAFDPAYYPVSGLLNFVHIRIDGKPITRFLLSQDVGGAIRGPARADLYFGFGVEARHAAETLGVSGKQYFLISR